MNYEDNISHHYALVIKLSAEKSDAYHYMLNLLNFIESNSYEAKDVGRADTFITWEYIVCDGVYYGIGSSKYSLEEKDTYKVVYNSIAAKRGEGLTSTEKAELYDELNYYLTEREGNKYEYTEDEAFNIVANYFNVTVQYLKEEVWGNYKIFEVWDTIYGKGK